jgi:hypothetical protein
MRFLTISETTHWCHSHALPLGEGDWPAEPDKSLHRLRADVPKSLDQLAWFCRFVEATLHPRHHCLLWVTAWGIWESSENWHLYYRLRQSYGDVRLIEEAPGHLFLNHESHDLVSFLQVGLSAGWDMHLLPAGGYGRAFVSHDGWIEFAMVEAGALTAIKADLARREQ